MSYAAKEVFYTLQGEGVNVGLPAVFCRFAGCNLWTGREEDRSTAVCRFCDTDFVGVDGAGGGRFASAQALANAVHQTWTAKSRPGVRPMVVCTGGEPLLQLDQELVDAFHGLDFRIAVETNGTRQPPQGIDWICVSPKARADLVLRQGHELKLVFPQEGAEPDIYEALDFQHFLLQPMDGPELRRNTEWAVQYCLKNPRWRLSLQTHKLIGIP